MSLYEQTYPNNIRTISGLVNVPYQDDCVLECDTSAGAVGIQLQDIPANKWNTLWKLYIIDKSGNASVNNITVTAPVGFLINGSSSFIINSNNATLIVRVSSNTNFAGSYSATVVGGGYNLIEDEGSPLPQRTTLNFVGGAVTVTDAGGKTVVTISGGGIISLTNAQMLNLINTSTVVAGQFYLITDCPNADEGVIVQGVKTNAVNTVQGNGIFLNADYQKVGNYSGVVGFVSALGLWSNDIVPVVAGNTVVWNNRNYVNLTGAWGSVPDLDAVNWALLPKSTTNGYIREVDFIKYNVYTNLIVHRADFRLNEVDYFDDKGAVTIALFPFGNDKVRRMKITGQSGCFFTNSNCFINDNFLQNGAITDNTPSSGSAGVIEKNVITASSGMTLNKTFGTVKGNILNNGNITISNIIDTGSELSFNSVATGGILSFTTINNSCLISDNKVSNQASLNGITASGGTISGCNISRSGNLLFFSKPIAFSIQNCEVTDGNVVDLGTVTANQINYRISSGYSNWVATIDWADPSIYSGLNVTIPVKLSYVGIFLCANPSSMANISNAPSNHEFIFQPTSGTLRINSPVASVGVAVAGDIITNEFTIINAPFYNAVYRANGCDYFGFKKVGNLIGWNIRNIWQ